MSFQELYIEPFFSQIWLKRRIQYTTIYYLPFGKGSITTLTAPTVTKPATIHSRAMLLCADPVNLFILIALCFYHRRRIALKQ